MCDFYKSPIDLQKKDITFNISQKIKLCGENKGAELNDKKIYVVNDKVILKVDDKKYRLVEYHFHHFENVSGCKSSEHALEGKKYDAEVHYVFQELEDGCEEHRNDCSKMDVCGGNVPENSGNLLVIGRFIKFSCHGHNKDLAKLQVKIPSKYFEYDGALTGEDSQGVVDCAAVRWIVGTKYLKFLGKQFTKTNTKTTRCLQDLDGRLILYSC